MSERIIIGCDAVHPDRRGGQHVAMKCSGVLIIDDEKQLGVMCNTERSQYGNKERAAALLAKLSRPALSADEVEALTWIRSIFTGTISVDGVLTKAGHAYQALDGLLDRLTGKGGAG
jgi:hypothetical protein